MSIALTSNDNYDLAGQTGTDGDNGSRWLGGKGSFSLDVATADSAVVTLQASFDDGTDWKAVGSDTTFTAATAGHLGNFELPPCRLRLNVASGTGSHASSADVRPIGCG